MEEPVTPSPEFAASRSAEALRELQARAHAAMSGRHESLSQLEADITRQIDALAETLAAQQAAEANGAATASEARTELDQLRTQLDQQDRDLRKRADQLAEFERQLKAREGAVDQRAAEFVQRDEELTQRQQELDLREHTLDRRDEAAESGQSQREIDGQAVAQREAEWQAERADLERKRSELAESLAALQQELKSREQEAAKTQARLAELETQIAEQAAVAASSQPSLDAARTKLESERDELQSALAVSRDALASAENTATEAVAERDELKQKFALAHEDVQRFRASVADLEQDLARRPAAGQTDSTELVALRAERDALAERLEALENQPAAPTDVAAGQQIADLQRRFEIAVEDVRELKTKNAQLESQLSAARALAGIHSDAGGMDWESQKRRMLAELEDEPVEGDPQRERERTSIANTIQITDAVVAGKDKEIARLQAQLAESGATPTFDEAAQQAAIRELVDTDAVIREHREKIAQIEQELDAKLRAAELEISVERAKIARQRVELDQLRIDLEAARKNIGSGGTVASPSVPKKRWLSKLGLSGDDQ